MGATRLTIVRHGETEWNKTLQLQGHGDSALTQTGIEQAVLVAESLKTRKFDVLISSDLGRAIHTAQIINRSLKLSLIVERNLRERSFGIMEGLTRDDIKDKYKDIFDAYITRVVNFEIPEGESLVEFNNRVIEALHSIARNYKNKSVLIVAHGGVLDCVIRHIFSINLDDPRCFSLFNTSVNTIYIDNNLWSLEEWGNIEHLHKIAVLNEMK
jgi:2,3-bisphosphoglycerate-dependent phosphoglycerate mutase